MVNRKRKIASALLIVLVLTIFLPHSNYEQVNANYWDTIFEAANQRRQRQAVGRSLIVFGGILLGGSLIAWAIHSSKNDKK